MNIHHQNINLDSILKCALDAASRASECIKKFRLESSFKVDLKGARNLVTTADTTAEKIIMDRILSEFPDHKFLAEESANDLAQDLSGPYWIIDPIDGTTNYAHGHPHVGISIAFAVDGEVLVGIVAAPFLNEIFKALKGQGAFCNDTKISISSTRKLSDALIATGFPYERDHVDLLTRRLSAVLMECRDIRRNGASSLDTCWVACGRLDGYYESVMPWDRAASTLIAREAGAVIGNFREESDHSKIWSEDLDGDRFLVANPGVFEELQEILRGA